MGNMGVVYSLMERLRELVGSCWDYCVIWKLNEDPWSLECVDCCCGGNYQKIGDEEDALLPTTTTTTGCKDVMFQHPRMRCCELLSQLPPSLPLDGINAEVLISNQPRWLKNAKISSDLSTTPTEEMMESKVLIPVPGGLVEFYAAKMVPEDQSLIDYVVSQCNALSLSDQANNNNNTMNMNGAEFPPYSPSTGLANLNLSSSADATADRIRICNSAMNFLQQFSYLTDQTPTSSNKDDDALLQGPPDDHNSNTLQHLPFGEANPSLDQAEKGSMKHDLGGRPDSGSDSDPIDDEDDPKYSRRKNGKGNQSKNLEAERKRRKKLNERLYLLRSLVPKISKLDRAAILGDAIEYVMELQKQEKDLQNELEHNSDDEGVGSSLITNPSQHQNGNIPLDYSNLIPVANTTNNKFVDSYEHGEPSGGFYAASSSSLKRSHEDCKTTTPSTFDNKGQQMEVQVEVAHLDGNEFFIKVFGEQKRGGFVRLMEALDSLGLEITTVNVTSCISLVSYVFTVEKKDSEMVQADYLRDTLLEMTRNQSGGEWAELVKAQTQAQTQTHHQLDQFQHPSYYNHHFHPF